MCKYYSEYNYVIDYFLQNLLIKVAYENIPSIKKAIDEVEVNNPHVYALYRYMDRPFEKDIWDSLVSDTGFFKLTQKRQYAMECNGKKTFYAYLKEGAEKYASK